MGCTVAEAQARTTSQEFAEWIAYSNLEPMGEGRTIALLGTLCALVANGIQGGGKGAHRFTAADFVPELEREATEGDPDGIPEASRADPERWFRGLAASAGIRFVERGPSSGDDRNT